MTCAYAYADTPRGLRAGVYAYVFDDGMSAKAGRARRPDNIPTVLLQARVDPTLREAVQEAAAESGVSVSYYVEHLLGALLEQSGALPAVRNPRPQHEELPINLAA